MAHLARFEAIARRSADVAMFFDHAFVIRWVSPAARQVFGIDESSLVGRNGLDLIHVDDRDRVATAFLEQLEGLGDHAEVVFRVFDGRGRVRWVEEVATDLLDDPAVGFVVGNLRDVTDRVEAHEAQLRAALHDDLTGLANRAQLLAAVRAPDPSSDRGRALVFFDVVHLCDVNNSLGPPAGDQLLVEIAERVAARIGDGCTFARIGNDQFAVLCPGEPALDLALGVVDMIRAELSTPFRIDGSDVFVVVCFGVARAAGVDGDQLVGQADMALHHAKQKGPDEVVVFEPELERRSQVRVSHAAALQRALGDGAVVPHYQPVIDLRTGRVVAVEALARWHDPVLGSVPPDVFIPIAEANGIITDLGTQILERACADAAGWLADGRRLQVAVNVSPVQLAHPGYTDVVGAILARTQLPPDQLTLEITETSELQDLDVAMDAVLVLAGRGVLFAVDDFGTGYSSLVLLSRLPIGAIKIDRSFVAGLGADPRLAQLVAGTVALSRAIGFRSVAEGVEHPDHVVALDRMGCEFGQGFLWSPPVPAGDLLEVIARIERSHPGTGGPDRRDPTGSDRTDGGHLRLVQP